MGQIWAEAAGRAHTPRPTSCDRRGQAQQEAGQEGKRERPHRQEAYFSALRVPSTAIRVQLPRCGAGRWFCGARGV